MFLFLTALYARGLLHISMEQVASLFRSATLYGPPTLSVKRLSRYLKLTLIISPVVIYNQSIDMLGFQLSITQYIDVIFYD